MTVKYEKLDFERRGWCWDCCALHTPERRQAVIRRMPVDVTAADIREAWGDHLWPHTIAGDRMLHRDLGVVFGARSHLAAERLRLAVRLVIGNGFAAKHAAAFVCSSENALLGELRRLGFRWTRRVGWSLPRRAA